MNGDKHKHVVTTSRWNLALTLIVLLIHILPLQAELMQNFPPIFLSHSLSFHTNKSKEKETSTDFPVGRLQAVLIVFSEYFL